MISVEVNSLVKSFGRKKVLNNVSLEFNEPGIITILGPNASGKTTLIKTILGMVFPDSGMVKVDGHDVSGRSEYKSKLNYLPQIAQFPENLRVSELFSLIEDLRGSSNKADELIDLFNLKGQLKERITVLSGGTKQKVNIVLAFMFDNPLLILDEPTNGLDPVALVRLKELIREEKERGKCIIITTHIMELVEDMSDRIVYMLEGHVHFNGTKAELKSKFNKPTVETSIASMLELSETEPSQTEITR